jgi:DNA-binding SARP family transcriptional activator/tetratricopeptide (TPR) repeat protein/TolB-like protein
VLYSLSREGYVPVITTPSAERHLSVSPTTEFPEKGGPTLRFTVLGSADLAGPNMGDLGVALMQPKRLALLAYLALASRRGFHRRDTLVGLFWPESDEERARHALRQALHTLRRALGPGVIVGRGDNELGIDHAALWCDARAFQEALDADDLEGAISLYRGDLLPGFYVSNASPDFEHWLEAERARLKARASTAAWTLSSRAEGQGDGAAAARWARIGLAFSPDDERSLRRLIALLDRVGDRAGALRAHDDFSRGLAAEFEAEPSAETKALIDSVRARQRAHEDGTLSRAPISDELRAPAVAGASPSLLSLSPSPSPSPSPSLTESRIQPTEASPRERSVRLRRTFALAASVAAALVIAAIGFAMSRHRGTDAHVAAPVVAVGNIVESGMTPADTLSAAGTLGELLSTDLARVSGVHVVSHSRLYEILGQIGKRELTSTAISDAARRAGATELLEGVLYRRAGNPGTLRLDLRRIELTTGVVSRAFSAEGTDLFSLVDSVTAQFARTLGLPRPTRSLAGVTSTSLVARRFYEQGLRWLYQGNTEAASGYFLAAFEEDSTFGMAAFYLALSGSFAERRRAIPLLARAAQNAADAPERERLLIRYSWAQMSGDPSAVALAESLAVRYPNEPNGERSWGSALFYAGDFVGAIPHLRRAVARDSLGFSKVAPVALCAACGAMQVIVAAYLHADSLGAAERAARQWVQMQPTSALPKMALAEVLGRSGRRAAALSEASSLARTAPVVVRDSWLDVRLALGAGDFDEAHRILRARSQEVDQGVRQDALWWTVIALRYQGRLAAANSAADRFCDRARLLRGAENSGLECSLATGPVLFDLGRYREAARLYESVAIAKEYQHSEAPMPGLTARHRSWMLTHAASAYAAAGDTTALKSLVDSVEKWGRLSGFGRDQRLHFHVRGLLSAARSRHTVAASLFRRALFSPSEGFTRTNLELGRELITVGRAPEAIGLLRPALRGPIESSNLYVTQTEIHEMLAKAFELAGAPDSAAVHYRRVAVAWRDSDARFRERAQAALRKSGSPR